MRRAHLLEQAGTQRSRFRAFALRVHMRAESPRAKQDEDNAELTQAAQGYGERHAQHHHRSGHHQDGDDAP
jgi:hypothetical protein